MKSHRFPAGDYYDVRPARISGSLLKASWIPEPNQAESIEGASGLAFGISAVVTCGSDSRLSRAVGDIAFYFLREFDTSLYYDVAARKDPHYKAYLWAGALREGKEQVFGACAFRLLEWADAPPSYSLDWVWFHPCERRQGHLTKAWPYFEKRLGPIAVRDRPNSPAREALLVMEPAF